jgi:hypothetical protein
MPDLVHRLLLLVVPLALVGPALLPGQRLVGSSGGAHPGDLPRDLTDATLMRRAVEEGSLPTWAPSLALGMPLAASGWHR